MHARQTYLENFFKTLNITSVLFCRKNEELTFILPKPIFEHHQHYLRRWFIVLEEHETYTLLAERWRGTDATSH
jgi:hypothetical protein